MKQNNLKNLQKWRKNRKDNTVSEKSKAHQQGKEAFLSGLSIAENPYPLKSTYNSEWLQGFMEAKNRFYEKE